MTWKACLIVCLCVGLPQGALAQSNLQCRTGYIIRSAHFLLEGNSRTAAIAAWTARATALLGPMWANWTNAADRSVTCRLSTMPTGLNGYLCTARGRACILQ